MIYIDAKLILFLHKKVILKEKQIIKGFIVCNKTKLLWFCTSLHRLQIFGVCVLYVVVVQYI